MKILCYVLTFNGNIVTHSDPRCRDADFMYISSSADLSNFSDTLVCFYDGKALPPQHVPLEFIIYARVFFDSFVEVSPAHCYFHLCFLSDCWGCSIDSLQYLI